MDGDPTPALTGRRRTRPTSIGCPNPWQPKPGRAPLIAAHAAVQTNRATSASALPDNAGIVLEVQTADLCCRRRLCGARSYAPVRAPSLMAQASNAAGVEHERGRTPRAEPE